jgi:hypothetical protein
MVKVIVVIFNKPRYFHKFIFQNDLKQTDFALVYRTLSFIFAVHFFGV